MIVAILTAITSLTAYVLTDSVLRFVDAWRRG